MHYMTIHLAFTIVALQHAPHAHTSQQVEDNPVPLLERYFSRTFYQKLALESRGGNLVVSPLSVDVVLSVLLEGADGTVRQQLIQVLGLDKFTGLSYQRIRESYRSMLREIKKNFFQMATRLFINGSFEIDKDFLNTTNEFYSCGAETVETSNKHETVKIINDFVMKHTNNKIRDILGANDVKNGSTMVCVATSHLQGHWALPFPQQLTKKQDFHSSLESRIPVNMMHMENHLNLIRHEALKAEIVALNFTEPMLSMVLILPEFASGLHQLEAQLAEMDSDSLFRLVHSSPPVRVQLSLPRFHLQSEFYLKSTLEQMGLGSLFSADADLSGISRCGGLHVSQIHQKTYLNVDEGGVEAADATVVRISNNENKEILREFKADRPFLFYIAYNKVILFQGRLVDPSE